MGGMRESNQTRQPAGANLPWGAIGDPLERLDELFRSHEGDPAMAAIKVAARRFLEAEERHAESGNT